MSLTPEQCAEQFDQWANQGPPRIPADRWDAEGTPSYHMRRGRAMAFADAAAFLREHCHGSPSLEDIGRLAVACHIATDAYVAYCEEGQPDFGAERERVLYEEMSTAAKALRAAITAYQETNL